MAVAAAGRVAAQLNFRATHAAPLARALSSACSMRTIEHRPNAYVLLPNTGGIPQVPLTFVTAEKEEVPVMADVGATVLEVALANAIDIEGACGGECACSTCHVMVDEESFARLPEAELEEEDMLDLAAGLTDTYASARRHTPRPPTLSRSRALAGPGCAARSL